MCLRNCIYVSIFMHFLPSMYDFMSVFIKNLILNYHCICMCCTSLISIPCMHVDEFSTVLTTYDTI